MKLFPIKYNWSCTVVQVTTRCWKKNHQTVGPIICISTLTARSLVQRRFASAKILLVIFIHS